MMNDSNFDFREFGRIEKGEIGLSTEVRQTGQNLEALLKFENLSKRDVNIYLGLWFTELEVSVDGASLSYGGPSASIPSPTREDFKTVKPGAKFESNAVSLTKYFGVPVKKGSRVKVSFNYEGIANATAEYTVK